MTPRERKDMKWILAAFAGVILVIVAGIVGGWDRQREISATVEARP
jgi:hypothetical protein